MVAHAEGQMVGRACLAMTHGTFRRPAANLYVAPIAEYAFKDVDVADYIQETGNHVMYRVTPIFRGLELVARGVQMEAYSVEDEGAGICFNVFCFNAQPGVVIDYVTGESVAE